MIMLELPWPPSVNKYWRHPSKGKLAGRHLISEEGRAYRKAVKSAVIAQVSGLHIGGGVYYATPMRADVRITAYPPDARRRDLDNLLKAPLDAIVHAGVIEDDSVIDRLLIARKDRVAGGKMVVMILPM